MEVKHLLVKIGADKEQYEKAMSGVSASIQKHKAQFRKAGMAMTAAGTAVVSSLGLMVKGYVKAGDEVHKMALRTGFSTEALSELKYAAEISGASLTDVEKGVKKMSKTIMDASEGLATYVRAFDRIGLSAEELIDLSPEEQFDKIAKAIAAVESPTIRAATAQEIFGRAGTQLLPLFAAGEEGLEALRAKAHEMGVVFDQEAAEKAAKLADASATLKASLKGVTMAIAEKLVPAITGIVDKIGIVLVKMKDWMGRHPKLSGLIAKVTLGIGALMMVLGPLVMILPTLAAGFTLLTGPIGLVMAAVVGLVAITALVIKNWKPISKFFKNIWKAIKGFFTDAVKRIKAVVVGWKDDVLGIFKTFSKIGKAIIKAYWTMIKTYFTLPIKAIKLLVKSEFSGKIIGFFTDLKIKTKEKIKAMWSDVKDFFTTAISDIKGFVKDFASSIIGFFTDLKKKAKDKIKTMWADIKAFFTDAIDSIKGFVSGFIGAIVDKFISLKTGVKEKASSMWVDIKGFFTGAITFIKERVRLFVEDVIKFFGNLKEKVIEKVKDMIDSIKGFFGGMWDKVKGGMDKVKGGIVGAFKSIKDKVVGKSIIPDMVTDILTCLAGLHADAVDELGEMRDDLKPIFDDIVADYEEATEEAKDATDDFRDDTEDKLITDSDSVSKHWQNLTINMGAAFGDAVGVLLTKGTDLKDALGVLWDGIKNAFKTMAVNMVTEWVTNFLKPLVAQTAAYVGNAASAAGAGTLFGPFIAFAAWVTYNMIPAVTGWFSAIADWLGLIDEYTGDVISRTQLWRGALEDVYDAYGNIIKISKGMLTRPPSGGEPGKQRTGPGWATGFEGIVTTPMRPLIGEVPEFVYIKPLSEMGGGVRQEAIKRERDIHVHNTFNIKTLDGTDFTRIIERKIMPKLNRAYRDNIGGFTSSLKEQTDKY